MRKWCADRYERYPVTPDDMNFYYERYIDGKHTCALTMVDGDNIVGYITRRGCGLGKALVSMAVKYAFEALGATKVSLGVFENNPSAIGCYESAGFIRVPKAEKECYECFGEIWNCIEMELLRSVH